jgi:WhiB family redox-sensing transcriptional regulator
MLTHVPAGSRPANARRTSSQDRITKRWAGSLPCQRDHGELWFSVQPAEYEQAKAYCHECPLREACLLGAIERAEPCGVWGGEIFHEGVIIARKNPRGRPRKADKPLQEATY